MDLYSIILSYALASYIVQAHRLWKNPEALESPILPIWLMVPVNVLAAPFLLPLDIITGEGP